MLVPTTVLAQQHLDTFAARMAAFPVRVEMLSRFRTDAQQRKVVEALAAGEVDIVIGTHRLVQPDLKFKDLGLVIIDEEQRFGVAHKETLKQFRRLCDVLTMSATPIPRTLYMSLTGARDMSVIQTPPRLRQPIQTLVATDRDEVLRAAIHRELNRGGQVFFLHNRVATISAVADRLAELVPEARIRTAHGQMHERELAAIMRSFSRGEFEILVCTTIVESGIDIPNVNTIFIDRADRFGLSDLYQLRGRVGRDRHQAYAYLLVPARGSLPGDARRRIQALTQHSSLGAGFRIAMRDLEIRGAGNLLGAEQSGHIAAIGFELYCQLLRRTVARLKHEDIPPIVEVEMKLDFLSLAPETEDRPDAAMIPTGYLEDERLRVQAYRAVAGAARDEDITALREDFADRFGPLPRALENLLAVAGLRILAARARIDTVEVREDKVMLLRHGDYLQADGRFPRLPDAPAPARLDALRAILETAAPRPWLRPPPVRAKRSEA